MANSQVDEMIQEGIVKPEKSHKLAVAIKELSNKRLNVVGTEVKTFNT